MLHSSVIRFFVESSNINAKTLIDKAIKFFKNEMAKGNDACYLPCYLVDGFNDIIKMSKETGIDIFGFKMAYYEKMKTHYSNIPSDEIMDKAFSYAQSDINNCSDVFVRYMNTGICNVRF